MAVNAKGTWLMTRAALPAMTDGGSIVNLASETAYSGSRHMTHYVASKAAVIGLTRAFARELGPAIRVNAIAPGYTDTEGGRGIGDPDTYDVSPTPLGRVGAARTTWSARSCTCSTRAARSSPARSCWSTAAA